MEKLYICTIMYVHLYGNTPNIYYIDPAAHILSPPRFDMAVVHYRGHYSLCMSGYGVKKSAPPPVRYSGRFDIGVFIISPPIVNRSLYR